MKLRTLAALFAVGFSAVCANAAITIDNGNYRIGTSHDGNAHDRDDYVAVGVEIALVHQAKIGSKYVHIDYADDLGLGTAAREKIMHDNVTGALSRFSTHGKSFDDQKVLSAATSDIANQINVSTATNTFYFGCCGTMEVPWEGINKSSTAHRRFATFISHSVNNDNETDSPLLKHKWSDIQKTGVKTIHIADQNLDGFKASLSAYSWMKNSSNPNLRWVYSLCVTSTFDCSDAGITYFIITGRGDQHATVPHIEEVLNGQVTLR